jgi:hypothetical protein
MATDFLGTSLAGLSPGLNLRHAVSRLQCSIALPIGGVTAGKGSVSVEEQESERNTCLKLGKFLCPGVIFPYGL